MHQEMVNEKYELYGDDPEDGQGMDYDSEFDEEVIQFKQDGKNMIGTKNKRTGLVNNTFESLQPSDDDELSSDSSEGELTNYIPRNRMLSHRQVFGKELKT